MGRDYIFAKLPAHPKSRYLEIRSSHVDTGESSSADALAFIKSVATD